MTATQTITERTFLGETRRAAVALLKAAGARKERGKDEWVGDGGATRLILREDGGGFWACSIA